jgi:MraZ protein
MLVNQRDHLTLFPATEWAAFEEQLLETPRLDPDAQRLRRFYASGSVPCPIDSQGRILVPGFLREHARIDNKFDETADNRVIVAGVFERVEIWNPAIFEASQSATIHELDDIQRTVDQITRS